MKTDPMNISDAARELTDTFIEGVRLLDRRLGYSDKGLPELRSIIIDAVRNAISKTTTGVALERDELQKQLDGLKDPAAVLVNILRGNIVLPAEFISKTDEFGEYQNLTTATAALTLELEQLRQQLAEARELLKERVFWTANDPAYSRQGYSAFIDSETSFRDVNYRNAPLHATAEEAIDAALKTLNPPTDEK